MGFHFTQSSQHGGVHLVHPTFLRKHIVIIYIYIYLESPKTFFFCVFVLGLICLRFCSKNAFLEMRLKVYIISCPKNQGPSAGESFEGPNPCGTCRVRSPSSSEGPMMVRVELLSEKASVQV